MRKQRTVKHKSKLELKRSLSKRILNRQSDLCLGNVFLDDVKDLLKDLDPVLEDAARLQWLEDSGVHILEFQQPNKRGVFHTRTALVSAESAGGLRQTIDYFRKLWAKKK